MPSPIGHAMAGAMTAWIGEIVSGAPKASPSGRLRSFVEKIADSINPLTVTCAVLAVSPDLDNFFHTHRTYSHSVGAAALVWMLVALVAWRLRLPVVFTATVCAAAYGSHVFLDWLGRDDGPHGGLMALWPLSMDYYKSGANLFLELVVRPRSDLLALVVHNIGAVAREVLILLPPFLLTWLVRVEAFARLAPQVSRRDKAA